MKNSQAEEERKEAVASSIEKLFPTSDGPVELKKVGYHLILLREDGGVEKTLAYIRWAGRVEGGVVSSHTLKGGWGGGG